MNEIKVGDWVEVTKAGYNDVMFGIRKGNAYRVEVLGREGGVKVRLEGKSGWWLTKNQIKKAKPLPVQTKELCTPLEYGDAKKERVASSHYQNANNNDVWQFVDDNLSAERVKGFHQTNAIKYVTRYHVKHDTVEKRIEDLEKAKVCIDKLIELERLG